MGNVVDGAAQHTTTNTFGDEQLKVDLLSDRMIFDRLKACSAVAAAASEETPELQHLCPDGAFVVKGNRLLLTTCAQERERDRGRV